MLSVVRLRRRTPPLPTFLRFHHHPPPKSAPQACENTKDRFLPAVSGDPRPRRWTVETKGGRKRTLYNPEVVLEIFKSCGVPETSFAAAVHKNRLFLYQHPENKLRPKLEFLRSVGCTGADVGRIITANPLILATSLEKRMVPFVNFLRKFVPRKFADLIVGVLERSGWILSSEHFPNFDLLKKHGMSAYSVIRLFIRHRKVLRLPAARLEFITVRLKGLGLDANSVMFAEAFCIVHSKSEEKLMQKVEAFKSLGWTEEEALVAFSRQPRCFNLADDELRRKVEFLRDVLGWDPSTMSKNPSMLMYSIEKRFKPRAAVLNLLMLKGMVNWNTGPWRFVISEKQFASKYVTKYQQTVPEVMKAYEGKSVFEGWEHVCAEKLRSVRSDSNVSEGAKEFHLVSSPNLNKPGKLSQH